MKKPTIRFKAFDGEWVERKMLDIAPLQRGFDLPNSQLKKGSVPVVCSNGIVAYHNEAKCKAPGLVTGRSGTIGKFTLILDGSYWPHNTSLWVTDFKKNLPVFISYLYQTIQIEKYATGSGVPTLNRNDVHEHKCFISIDMSEQAAIGSFFTELDSLIEGKRVKLDKLKKLKQAYLGKMFPKKGSRVPEVRFKGFSGEWIESRFDELYTKVTEKNDFTYDTDRIISVANMYFKNDAYITDRNYLLTYNVFKTGDIAFEGNKSKNFSHGRFVENTIGDGIISHVFDVFRPKVEYDLLYWKYAINNERVMRDVLIRCTKQSTMMTNLVASDFLKQKILHPSVPEQQKIGAFFQNIDNLINLQQQELDKLSNIKSACLSKMFA